MTFMAAAFWNQIAKTQALETPAAKVAFRLNSDQLCAQDDLWMQVEAEAGTPWEVARCLPTCLPLLLEADAINQYVSQNPSMRAALPEILDPEEAALLMQLEYRLSDQDKTSLAQLLSHPQAAEERWLRAATQAANRSPQGAVKGGGVGPDTWPEAGSLRPAEACVCQNPPT